MRFSPDDFTGRLDAAFAIVPSNLIPARYPYGTYLAAAGLIILALYYDHAWRRLKHRPNSSISTAIDPVSDAFPEVRYLYWGTGISVACFLLAGAADMPNDLLDRVEGALMGLCGALFAAMLGFGFVSLWNLWKEVLLQVKYAWHLQRLVKSKGIKTPSILRPIFTAILWLACGLGVFLAMGFLLGLIPESWQRYIPKELLWLPILAMFGALWRSRTYAALLLRLILLFAFSAIMFAFTIFLAPRAAAQIAPALVTFLTLIAALNSLFYARWVRHKALINNLE